MMRTSAKFPAPRALSHPPTVGGLMTGSESGFDSLHRLIKEMATKLEGLKLEVKAEISTLRDIHQEEKHRLNAVSEKLERIVGRIEPDEGESLGEKLVTIRDRLDYHCERLESHDGEFKDVDKRLIIQKTEIIGAKQLVHDKFAARDKAALGVVASVVAVLGTLVGALKWLFDHATGKP